MEIDRYAGYAMKTINNNKNMLNFFLYEKTLNLLNFAQWKSGTDVHYKSFQKSHQH